MRLNKETIDRPRESLTIRPSLNERLMVNSKLLRQISHLRDIYIAANNIPHAVVTTNNTYKAANRTDGDGRVVLCCKLLLGPKRHSLSLHSGFFQLNCPIQDHVPHRIHDANKGTAPNEIRHLPEFDIHILIQLVN